MVVKKGETVVLASTRKGLFVAHSKDRRRWKVEGPSFEGVEVKHAALAPDGRTIYAAANSWHWGATVQKSTSFGARWAKHAEQPKYAEGTDLSMKAVWHVEPAPDGALYAGVEPAGLFRSDDEGKTWQSVEGLNARPDRKEWQPGGGGLCLHTILPHPKDSKRMVVGISAVGVLETRDGGVTWHVRNGNIKADFLPQKVLAEDELGACPHKLARDPKDPGTLHLQHHGGFYTRKEDATGWKETGKGLPSRFGFALAAHRTEPILYTVPLVADMNRVTPDGAFKVWRSRDSGKSWKPLAKGLPQKNAFVTVLREGLATDPDGGVYVGTTTGELYASRDEGNSWAAIGEHLPPILAVEAGVAR